ncbi:MAG: hypothetical protein OXT09_37665 [Myxococcales bacterium]|nr:hypothetical protein [Myxococcales bacterium]
MLRLGGLALVVGCAGCEPVRTFSLLDASVPEEHAEAGMETVVASPEDAGTPEPAVAPELDAAQGEPDAGEPDAGALVCGDERCEAPEIGDGFVTAACCVEGRQCGARIVSGPIEVVDTCIGLSRHAASNTDCVVRDFDGVPLDYGCCMGDGTCGTSLPRPDGELWCIDGRTLGLPGGLPCAPEGDCAYTGEPCEDEADCCPFAEGVDCAPSADGDTVCVRLP